MAFSAPNYTQTPNDLIDKWLPHLGNAELKVLLVIIRKTFGWHKVRDKISLTQLQNITGLERRHVLKGVRGLIEKGLIIKQVEGPKQAQVTFYELLVIDDSNNFTQCLLDTPPSVFRTPTKETLPKENKKESSPQGGAKEKSAAPPPPPEESFYKEKFENKIHVTKKQRDRLLEKYGGMESLLDSYAEKIYRWAMQNPDKFKKRKRHDMMIEDWIDKDLEKKKLPTSAGSAENDNWEKNQELVSKLKIYSPHKYGGLYFYYKAFLLKDKNNPDIDISGKAPHADFKAYLEKKYNMQVVDED